MQITVVKYFEPIQENIGILNENIGIINSTVENLESKFDGSKEDMTKLLNNALIDYQKTFIMDNKTDAIHNNTKIIAEYHNKVKQGEKEGRNKRTISGFLKSMVNFVQFYYFYF